MAKISTATAAVLTGAGISAESGLSLFRGGGGLWEGYPVQEVATPEGFRKDPARVWRFYHQRRLQAAKSLPNSGHRALADVENKLGNRLTLITQNVDGLHQAAGSRRVLEIHGSLWRIRCVRCGTECEDRREAFEELPPRCSCGGLMRPCVVWFGEVLPQDIFARAVQAAAESTVFAVVGTSAVVEPAASLARVAAGEGAEVWEVNPEETPLSALAERVYRRSAAEIMDRVAIDLLRRLGED
ncbi:MAG: NAD-dependent deacylase [Acidobacteriota bacterium]|jgi:NAD-dependent deacetylase